ncbi:MAG: hypothetical protein JO331_05975 [Verrucomicrobia bacterium]|nr:hypothetical protein [Verrucomicrobiota bacterium]
MWRYIREAFWARPEIAGLGKVPVNVILLAGVGILGFGEHALWLAGLGAEVAYLYACFTNDRFRRWVDARNMVVEKTSAEQQRLDLANALIPPRREKLQKLQKRCDRILELYRQNQTDSVIVETNQHSLERMTWYYLKLLLAQQNLESLASEADATALTRQIDELRREIDAQSAHENLRESKLAIIRVLEKRLQNLDRREEILREIASDLTRIEAEVELALENAGLAGQTNTISAQIDLLGSSFDDSVFGDSALSVRAVEAEQKLNIGQHSQ